MKGCGGWDFGETRGEGALCMIAGKYEYAGVRKGRGGVDWRIGMGNVGGRMGSWELHVHVQSLITNRMGDVAIVWRNSPNGFVDDRAAYL